MWICDKHDTAGDGAWDCGLCACELRVLKAAKAHYLAHRNLEVDGIWLEAIEAEAKAEEFAAVAAWIKALEDDENSRGGLT